MRDPKKPRPRAKNRSWMIAALTMSLAVGGPGPSWAEEPQQISNERFNLTGTYRGANNGECDLGSMDLEMIRTPRSRVREDVALNINARLKDPRSWTASDFEIQAVYSVWRDLIIQESFTLKKDGDIHIVDPDNHPEERLLQSYLPMLYMALKTGGKTRYTVTPRKGESAQFITLDRREKEGGSEAVLVKIEWDPMTGLDKVTDVARFGLSASESGQLRLDSLWVIVFDRPSLYFELSGDIASAD